MYKIILLLLFTTFLNADRVYTNCDFQNEHYGDICEKTVKNGVSYQYANHFLLSYFQDTQFDEVSWKYLQPNKIMHHRTQEQKANNVLVKYVSKMVKNLQEYEEVYDYIEKEFGVNREIIAAILLKETKLGEIHPTHDAFIVFNTMVLRTDPNSSREKWLLKIGKSNMASIIIHCYKKGVEPRECRLPSSYAGAVGIPQFMPNSFVYAKAYKGEISDLTKMEDAIVSAANFLHKKAKFSVPIVWDIMPNVVKIEKEWYQYAFEHKDSSFVYEKSKSGKKYNCFTKTKPELEYMKDYIKKIMRYNNSSNYAVGVMRLAYDAHYQLKKI